jgi:hypothetical protein
MKLFASHSGDTTTIAGDCVCCGGLVTVTVPRKQFDVWQSPNRPYIQDCFPGLPVGEREFLISQICNSCFSGMFK